MMAAVKRADTKPELALRRALHRDGVRFRLQANDVFGHPDLVVRKFKIAVFVDGDMWHGNEHVRRGLPSLEALFPTNTQFWCEKIRRNVERDREVDERLRSGGWTVIRLWTTDVLADPDAAARIVEEALSQSRTAGGHRRENGSGSDGQVL
jgi:DNA mismatch endonuclease (patch repair protein)